MANVNITKEVITHLNPAPRPEPGTLLQVRHGKVKTLVNEPSGIFKKEIDSRCYVSTTGLVGDEHVYFTHGGIDRALHQYCSSHYADWRTESSPRPELFQYGGFGENLVATNMNEENVCIGDLFRIGDEVVVQVSEPRSPCYKLNLRFEWPRALKRIQRTGRVGWNFRVLKPGWIGKGDTVVLIDRPNSLWSVMNVKRVIQGKSVPLSLVAELTQLTVMTDQLRGYAQKRLENTPKTYSLTTVELVTSRVKHLTFELDEPITIYKAAFQDFAFAQIEFGPSNDTFKRSYSIVSGDMNRFTLGVSLDDHSRGGSAYIHKELLLGDKIQMAPGSNPAANEDEERCVREDCVSKRIVVIGGIGVTAFLPIIKVWDAKDLPYEIHYAVRDLKEAAFWSWLPADKTTLYAKSREERLNVNDVIPGTVSDGIFRTKIYACGPSGLMNACQFRVEALGYPSHLLHFESFGTAAGGPRGDPFDVQVNDVENGRSTALEVPADKTLLQVLREAGFDMTYFCEAGGCGACKVTVCDGKVKHNSSGLKGSDKETSMLSCVDRGLAEIKIELD